MALGEDYIATCWFGTLLTVLLLCVWVFMDRLFKTVPVYAEFKKKKKPKKNPHFKKSLCMCGLGISLLPLACPATVYTSYSLHRLVFLAVYAS